jgi:hypothetical protein
VGEGGVGGLKLPFLPDLSIFYNSFVAKFTSSLSNLSFVLYESTINPAKAVLLYVGLLLKSNFGLLFLNNAFSIINGKN